MHTHNPPASMELHVRVYVYVYMGSQGVCTWVYGYLSTHTTVSLLHARSYYTRQGVGFRV